MKRAQDSWKGEVAVEGVKINDIYNDDATTFLSNSVEEMLEIVQM